MSVNPVLNKGGTKHILTGLKKFITKSAIPEEYDTVIDECSWHVRKFKSGYCEFSGQKLYKNVPMTRLITADSGIYTTELEWSLGGIPYPIPLLKVYTAHSSVFCTDTALTLSLRYNGEKDLTISSCEIVPAVFSSRTRDVILNIFASGVIE